MKMARLSRAAGLLNLARLALERLLDRDEDHLLALRSLRDLLSEIGDVAACCQVRRLGAAVGDRAYYALTITPYSNMRSLAV